MNYLPFKAIAGFLNLFVIMSAELFIPAWTLDFWQAWLFLVSFFGPVLFITAYFLKRDPALIQRRMKVGPVAEQRLSQKLIQSFASLFFILVILVPGFDHRYQWSFVPSALVVASNLAVTSGLLIVFFVFRENTFSSAVVEVTEMQSVISTGPYSIVRHPMYSGAMIFLLFTPLALNSWWGLLAVPPLMAVIILRLLDEEKLLVEKLPGYKEYRAQVRWRLLPHMW
jgi:protein-S-isoprenylcysteine O-methyltransferase Ste14